MTFAAVTNRDIDLIHYGLEAGLLAGYRGELWELHAGLHSQSELRQGAGKFRFVEVAALSLGLGLRAGPVWLTPNAHAALPFDVGRESVGPPALRFGLRLHAASAGGFW